MTLQRLLATCVWALTLGVVVSVEVALGRLLLDGSADWRFFAASAVVAVLTLFYMRWLSPRLHRDEQPAWRLAPAEAVPLLPLTMGACWLAAGVASSDYWPDWVGSAVGACAATVVAGYLLGRLERRTPTGA